MQHLLFSLCLAAVLGVGTAEARNPGDMGETIPVIISPKEGDAVLGNRGPVVIPISGYVDPSIGAVVLDFSQPCGTVQISFDNLSDGSYYATSVSGTGAVVIPLTLTSGSWTVTITLSSGSVYIGKFTLF